MSAPTDGAEPLSLRQQLWLCERCGRDLNRHCDATGEKAAAGLLIRVTTPEGWHAVPCHLVPLGSVADDYRADTGFALTFGMLQHQQKVWSQYNFPGERPGYQAMFGVMEELGELAHAILKKEQGIRGTPAQLDADAQDAVGDMLVFLADVCTRYGWNMQEIIEKTWFQVRTRDWKKFPKNGRTE